MGVQKIQSSLLRNFETENDSDFWLAILFGFNFVPSSS